MKFKEKLEITNEIKEIIRSLMLELDTKLIPDDIKGIFLLKQKPNLFKIYQLLYFF